MAYLSQHPQCPSLPPHVLLMIIKPAVNQSANKCIVVVFIVTVSCRVRNCFSTTVLQKPILIMIYDLLSFFPVGRGTLLQVSPITAGPL